MIMSKSNHFQPWKQNSTSVNNQISNYYGKTESLPITNLSSSSSNSFTSDINSQSQLEKFTNFYKMNNLNKSNESEENNEEVRERKMQQFVEAAIGDHAKQQILQILEKISLLKPPERLLLYLRMPGGAQETDPLRQPQNPLGTRSEINHTINWVRSHLENDPNVSIPKQDVYDDYVSYCTRVEIKPLSTADFGKVMKQVFPGIRPRRLGTRGHSRYCYAAMRKATKLDPPILPDLNPNNCSEPSSESTDDDSWKIVKSWSEGLLNTSFCSLKELASHITKHLNSSTNNSRQLLPKKILQRDLKERNKNKDESITQKKRKKKKRQISDDDNDNVDQSNENTRIITNDYNCNKMADNIKTEYEDLLIPMNLANDQDQVHKNQGTNLDCDNRDTKTIKHRKPVVKQTTSSTINEQNLNENIKKEYLIKEPSPVVYCKKVRQAHQSKWAATAMQQQRQQQQYLNDQSMKPPQSTITNFQSNQLINDNNIPQAQLKRLQMIRDSSTFNVPHRKKRFIQQHDQQENNGLNLQTNNNDGESNEFIIPRERVISICNLDKDALDDYLNGGDNSQEQEAELLQYFQPENEEKVSDANELGSTVQTSVPLLENYNLLTDCKLEKNEGYKISQLRSYLQQNLQTNATKNDLINNNNSSKLNQEQQFQQYTGSASASLAMLSQRHHTTTTAAATTDTSTTTLTEVTNQNPLITNFNNNNNNKGPKRKLNLNMSVPSSPNARRRNLNFVPISSPQLTHGNFSTMNNNNNYINSNNNNNINHQKMYNMSPFVSPTPFVKKPMNRSMAVNKLPNLTMPNDHVTSFSKIRTMKNEISASAPPSPNSMIINTCLSQNSGYQFSSISSNQQSQCSPDLYQLENRSQSVPLHCRSPNFNNFEYQGFSSTCNSVAQTPVPPEFADFNNTDLIDMLNETNVPSSVKIEGNDFIPSLLDSDTVASNTSVGMTEILPEFNQQSNFNPLSRSVPSTPLPLSSGYNTGSSSSCKTSKFFDNSKSVPTTPISTTPFRYSPETNRDFLINGNTIERGKLAAFYHHHQQQNHSVIDKNLSLADGIDELTNFDEVTDPIIGSDLLNNL